MEFTDPMHWKTCQLHTFWAFWFDKQEAGKRALWFKKVERSRKGKGRDDSGEQDDDEEDNNGEQDNGREQDDDEEQDDVGNKEADRTEGGRDEERENEEVNKPAHQKTTDELLDDENNAGSSWKRHGKRGRVETEEPEGEVPEDGDQRGGKNKRPRVHTPDDAGGQLDDGSPAFALQGASSPEDIAMRKASFLQGLCADGKYQGLLTALVDAPVSNFQPARIWA